MSIILCLTTSSKSSFNAGVLGWEAGDQIAICDGANVAVATLASADIKNDGASASIRVSGLDASAAAAKTTSRSFSFKEICISNAEDCR